MQTTNESETVHISPTSNRRADVYHTDPECGARREINRRSGVRYARPRTHACTKCMFVGVFGQWDDAEPMPASDKERGP